MNLVPFRWLRHPALLKSLEISPEDLVPVKDLPPTDLAYKALIDAGQSARVLDLGTASASPWTLDSTKAHLYPRPQFLVLFKINSAR